MKNHYSMSMKRRCKQGLLAVFMLPGMLLAQAVNTYNFTQSSGTYALITGGTVSHASGWDDTQVNNVAIGFSFTFNGVAYTQCNINPNGSITFGSTTSPSYTPISGTGGYSGAIGAWGRDLQAQNTAPLGEIRYLSSGGVFTVQWTNARRYFSSTTNAERMDMQIQLHQATGEVRVVYGTWSDAVSATTTNLGQVGLRGATNAVYNNREVLTAGNWSASTAGASNTATCYYNQATIATKPVSGQTYSWMPPVVVDLAVTGMTLPPTVACYGATETVTATVQNTGNTNLNFGTTPVTVATTLTGASAALLSGTLSTGTLAPGASTSVTMSTTLDMSAVGTYNFALASSMTGDSNAGNNSFSTSRSKTAPVALPQTVDFSGFTGANLTTVFPNWREANTATVPAGTTSTWNFNNVWSPANTTARLNLFGSSVNEWVVGPKVLATASTVLNYKIAITDWSSGGTTAVDPSGMQTTDDRVIIRVSTDCGASYTDLFTHNAANTTSITNSLVNQSVNLSSFAGQEIIVAFFGTSAPVSNTPDYDFHIDDIFLGTPPTIDMGATALVAPLATGCYGAAETVTVTIRNFGATTIDFSTNPVTVVATATGGYSSSTVLNTGTLASLTNQNVTMPATINMTAGGVYTFNANATVSGDGNTGNDAMAPVNRTVIAPIATPYAQDFSAGTGTPAGWNTTGWTIASSHGRTDNGLYKNIYSTFPTGQFSIVKVGPVQSSDALKFDYRIVDFTSYPATATPNTPAWGNIAIEASTNCGVTFSPFQVIDPSNHVSTTAWATKTYPLSSFAGQQVIFRVTATWAVGDWFADFDNFNISTPPAIDMSATALVAPLATGCYGAAEAVTVTIRNFGSATIDYSVDPVTVTATATGGYNSNIVLNSGTLAPLATQNVILPATIDMTAGGVFTFNANTAVTGDGTAANDAMTPVNRTSIAPVATPYSQNFSASTATPAGWNTTGWTIDAAHGRTNNGLYKNLFPSATSGQFSIVKVGPVQSGDVLQFDYRIVNFSGYPATATPNSPAWGNILIEASTDCGVSYSTFQVIDPSNHAAANTWATKGYPINSLAGQQVIFRVSATWAAGGWYVDLDNFNISTPATIDMGATVLVTPVTTGCYGAAEPVTVTIRNYAVTPIDYSVNPVTVTATATGGYSSSIVLNTGTLASLTSQNVALPATINMTAAGTYTFNANTSVTGDGTPANDAMVAVNRTVTATATLPQNNDFTGFTGSNLTTVFPNWREGAGATLPAGTTSNWVSSTAIAGSGTTAKINLYTNTRNEWIVGPKVVPTATSALQFKVAITDFASSAADPSGMQGTDDRVIVRISTDCGASYSDLFTYNAANTVTISNTLVQQSISLSAYAGQQVIVAFFATDGPLDDTPDYDFHIDDIFIGTPPTCPATTAVNVSGITGSGANVNFTCTGCTGSFIAEYGTTGFTPGTGAIAGGGTIMTGGASPITLSGLAAQTTYQVYVRQNCGGGDISANAGPVSFTTGCATTAIPVSEGFNAATIPACWAQQTVVGTSNITYPSSGSNPTTSPFEGSNMVYWNSFSITNNNETRLRSLPLSTTGSPSVLVEFEWRENNNTSYSAGQYLLEGVTVQYSLNGTTWTDMQFYPRHNGTLTAGTAQWSHKTLVAPAAVGNQSQVYIGFKFHSGFGDNCFMDLVNISPAATNVSCATAEPISCGATVNGNTAVGTNTLPSTACAFNGAASTGGVNWWAYTAASDQDVLLSTCGLTSYDNRISVFAATPDCNSLVCVAQNDDVVGCATGSAEVELPVTTGTTYYIAVHGVTTGTFQMTMVCAASCAPVAANTTCSSAAVLPTYLVDGSGATLVVDNTCAYTDARTSCSGALPVQGLWYSFNSGTYTKYRLLLNDATTNGALSANGASFALYSGACSANGAAGELACVGSAAGLTDLPTLLTSTNYTLLIYNQGGIGTQGSLELLLEYLADADAEITQVISPTGNICGSQFQPEVTLKNNAGLPLTSVNIVVNIDGGSPVLTYPWTGSLATGASVNVVLPTVNTPTGPHTLNVFTQMPNGMVDEIPSNDQASSSYDASGELVKVHIISDGAGAETTWLIEDDFFTTVASGGPYANNVDVTEAHCLNTDNGDCFHLKVLDSMGDGMCCTNGMGSWEVLDAFDRIIIKDDGQFTDQSPAMPPANTAYFTHDFCLPLGPTAPEPSECGVFSNTLLNKVYCTPVAGVSTYQFEFSDPNAGFFRRIAVPRPWVRFSEMQTVPLVPGITYFCRVKADQGNDGLFNDNWGPGCEMGLDANQVPGCTSLIDNTALPTHSCGAVKVFGGSDKIWAIPVVGASSYRFSFSNPSEGFLRNIVRPSYVCVLNWATLPLTSGTYDVSVEVLVNGTWSGFCGPACQLTIVSSASAANGGTQASTDTQMLMFPNPNRGDQVQLMVSELQGEHQQIMVDVYDMFGKRIQTNQFENRGQVFHTELGFENELAAGSYLIKLAIDGRSYQQTLIVQ